METPIANVGSAGGSKRSGDVAHNTLEVSQHDGRTPLVDATQVKASGTASRPEPLNRLACLTRAVITQAFMQIMMDQLLAVELIMMMMMMMMMMQLLQMKMHLARVPRKSC